MRGELVRSARGTFSTKLDLTVDELVELGVVVDGYPDILALRSHTKSSLDHLLACMALFKTMNRTSLCISRNRHDQQCIVDDGSGRGRLSRVESKCTEWEVEMYDLRTTS